MVPSWTNYVSKCKSSLSAIARSCFLRRAHWHAKCQEAWQAMEQLLEVVAQREAECQQLEQANEELRQRVAELEAKLAEPRSLALPVGDVPPGQQYGANLIALCVNLGRKLGIRRTECALKIF